MKFLCVACDEPMALRETRGPDDGSMTLVFGCPACGYQVAMLTNAMETQMVRALDVKIGGRTVPAEPMERVRATLAHQRDDAFAAAPSPAQEQPGGSKCPFSGVVAEAFARQEQPAGFVWSAEAEARMARVPAFVRPMARKGVEDYARQQGYAEITPAVMDEVKGRFGM